MCKAIALQNSEKQSPKALEAGVSREDWDSMRDSMRMTTSALEAERSKMQAERESEEQRNRELLRLRDRVAELEAIPEDFVSPTHYREPDMASLLGSPSSDEAHQAELASLRKELGVVSNEANFKIDAANERIRAVRKERDDALEKTKALDSELQEHKSAAERPIEADAAHDQQMKILLDEKLRLGEDKTRGARDLEKMMEANRNISEEKARYARDLEKMKDENKRLLEREADDKARGARDLERLAAENKKLSEREGQARSKVDELAKSQKATSSLCKEWKCRIDTMNATISELKSVKGQQEKQHDNMQATVQGAQVEVSTLQSSNDRLQAELDTLRGKLDHIGAEVNHKIDKANERIKSVKIERDEMKQE